MLLLLDVDQPVDVGFHLHEPLFAYPHYAFPLPVSPAVRQSVVSVWVVAPVRAAGALVRVFQPDLAQLSAYGVHHMKIWDEAAHPGFAAIAHVGFVGQLFADFPMPAFHRVAAFAETLPKQLVQKIGRAQFMRCHQVWVLRNRLQPLPKLVP